jgi:hypothetical protein
MHRQLRRAALDRTDPKCSSLGPKAHAARCSPGLPCTVVTHADSRCPSMLEDTQCQLRARHRSAHAARDGEALISWTNPAAGEQAKVIALDWYLEPPA